MTVSELIGYDIRIYLNEDDAVMLYIYFHDMKDARVIPLTPTQCYEVGTYLLNKAGKGEAWPKTSAVKH